jgi:hypothetical protein
MPIVLPPVNRSRPQLERVDQGTRHGSDQLSQHGVPAAAAIGAVFVPQRYGMFRSPSQNNPNAQNPRFH